MNRWSVWHQWSPVRCIGFEAGKGGERERVFAPAVFERGEVEAADAAGAIAIAKKLGLSPHPMVRAV